MKKPFEHLQFCPFYVNFYAANSRHVEISERLIAFPQANIAERVVKKIGPEPLHDTCARAVVSTTAVNFQELIGVRETNREDCKVPDVILLQKALEHQTATYLRLEPDVLARRVQGQDFEHGLSQVGPHIHKYSCPALQDALEGGIQPFLPCVPMRRLQGDGVGKQPLYFVDSVTEFNLPSPCQASGHNSFSKNCSEIHSRYSHVTIVRRRINSGEGPKNRQEYTLEAD